MTNNQSWWLTIVETALLGTDRRQPDLTQLPAELRSIDAGLSAEKTLLRTSALAGNYLRAGAEPLSVALPDLPVCPPETKAYAPKEAMRLLDEMLDEQMPNRRLLEKWVNKCRERDWVLPANRLVQVMSRQNKGEFEVDSDLVYDLLGNRGIWLGQFNPDWVYESPRSPEQTYQNSAGISRAFAIIDIGSTDPDRARVLVEEAWPQEPLSERKWFLSALSIHNRLSLADVPLLEKFRAELAKVKKPKPVQTDLYEQVTQMLLAVPGSALFDEVTAQLKKYVSKRSGIIESMTGKTAKSLQLPDKPDGFFNQQTMQSLGIISSSELTAPLQNVAWLMNIIIRIHPTCWNLILENDSLNPVHFFMSQSWIKDEEDGMVHTLGMMIEKFRRAEWVADLLPYRTLVSDWPKLLELIPPDEQQVMIQNHFDLTEMYGNYQFLTRAESVAPWSLPFSEYVWTAMLKTWEKRPRIEGAERQFFRDALTVIHPAILVTAGSILNQFIPELQQHTAHLHLLHPLKTGLAMRQAIDNL